MSAIRDGELETAVEMSAAVSAGSVSAAELVERALERARLRQAELNAFSQLWPEEAAAAATSVPAVAGPLGGIPYAAKDLFDVAGHPTTGCCRAYEGVVARHDAPAVAAARRAGLIAIGKTNQHELAAGGTNLVSACGPTRNPWDPDRMTGGSSGGSAAAVAAGVVPWALGSDTGGSIRIPSSFCGVVGLKPTTGLLPTGGMLPLAPSLDCPGPIAATVEDCWLLFEVLAGLPADPATVRARLLDAPPSRFRIGVPDGFFAGTVHPEALAAVRGASDALAAAGAEVIGLDGRGIEDARSAWSRICWPEFGPAHPALADPSRRALVDPTVLDWIERGEALSAEEREAAGRRREEIRAWFLDRLGGLDALLVPTTPYPAPRATDERVDLGPAGSVRVDRIGPGYLTCSVNLAGLPAMSLPAGWSSDGMPLGVSLVGRDREEETLARLAARWQAEAAPRPSRPPG